MRLKSYFAGTVESAMRLARQEMGEEALLVNSRKAPPEARHLGEYEVVFAVAPALPAPEESPEAGAKPGAEANGPSHAAPPPPPGARTPSHDLAGEVAEIRRQLERMAAAVARSNSLTCGRQFGKPELAEAFAILTAAEVEPELALAITRAVESHLDGDPFSGVSRILAEIRHDEGIDTAGTLATRRVRRALADELMSRIQTASDLASTPEAGRGGRRPRVLALVGPPGAGKTTTLAKLAVTYGITARRPTQLISVDTIRIAAAEQLRSYAAILGAGFQACETVGALAQALEECKHKDLVLIDTPGHSPKDLALSEDLARFLASRSDIETHLVLSCSTKPADLSRVVDRFQSFRPTRLIFTRLDETETYGVIVNEALRANLPVSYLTHGQQVPEDLQPATKSGIVDLVLNPGRSNSRTVEQVAAAAGRAG